MKFLVENWYIIVAFAAMIALAATVAELVEKVSALEEKEAK